MNGRVLIHAGIHKTGSTAIQSALHLARGKLAEAKFVYPAATDGRKAHHDLAFHLRGTDAKRTIAEHYARLYAEAAAAGAVLLLSSEEFEFAVVSGSIKDLRRLFNGAEFRLIYYICRQDILIEREYNQHVKQPATAYSGSIQDFYLKYNFNSRMNYYNCLRVIEKHFGPEAAIIRVFEPGRLVGGDVVADFFDAAGLPAGAIPEQVFRDNPSLSAPALELVRRINSIGLDEARRERLMQRMHRADGEAWSRPRLLSTQNRRDLLRRFESTNNDLFDALGESNPWTADAVVEEPAPDLEAEFNRLIAELLSAP